jgi:hypothetical protein
VDVTTTFNCDVGDELIGTVGHASQQLDASRSTPLDEVIDNASHHTTSVVVAAGIQISVARHGDPQRRQWVVMRPHARSLAPVPASLDDEDRVAGGVGKWEGYVAEGAGVLDGSAQQTHCFLCGHNGIGYEPEVHQSGVVAIAEFWVHSSSGGVLDDRNLEPVLD